MSKMTPIQKLVCALWIAGALIQFSLTLARGTSFTVSAIETGYIALFIATLNFSIFAVVRAFSDIGLSIIIKKKLGASGAAAVLTALLTFIFINAYGFFRIRSYFGGGGDKPVKLGAQLSDWRFYAAAGVIFIVSISAAIVLSRIDLNRLRSGGKTPAGFSVPQVLFIIITVGMAWHIFYANAWNVSIFSKPAPPPDKKLPNVILITIDTLSSYYTDFFYGDGTTPNMMKVASEGVSFPRTMTSIGITAPSHSTILTGLSPQTHGLLNNTNSLPDEVITLAEILREHGYSTAAFTNVFHTSTRYNIHQGFDTFLTEWYNASFAVTLLYDADVAGFLIRRFMKSSFKKNNPNPEYENLYKALQWVDLQGDRQPFFLWYHSYIPHRRYAPTKEIREKFGVTSLPDWHSQPEPYVMEDVTAGRLDRAEVKDLYVKMYRGDIYMADMAIAKFLDKLREKNLLDNSILVITADHGEHVMSHYDFVGHGYYNYDDMLLVPLIIRYPGVVPAGEVRRQKFKLLDVTPTILQALGLPEIPGAEGRGMFNMVLDASVPEPLEPFVSETIPPSSLTYRNATHYGDLKYMVDYDNGAEEFYNIIDDPWERNNMIESPAMEENVELLRGMTARWVHDTKPKMSADQEPMTEEVKQKLKDLGYIH